MTGVSPSTEDAIDVPEVSFVLPARNEELLLARTLQWIHDAATANSISYEIIVANDASTDATVRIAQAAGAQVIDVCLHNIGAVRNAGAAAARGRFLFFLDADTLLPPATLAAALRALRSGASGGASVEIEGITRVQQMLAAAFTWFWQTACRWAAGCCIFVERQTFYDIGGFNPKYFAAEEKYFSQALKQRGKFVILKEAVVTSGRKLRIYKTRTLLGIAFRGLILQRGQLTSPQGLEMLYDAPRESSLPGLSGVNDPPVK